MAAESESLARRMGEIAGVVGAFEVCAVVVMGSSYGPGANEGGGGVYVSVLLGI